MAQRPTAPAAPSLGVDIGGTTILAAAVLPDGTVAGRHAEPTPGDGGGGDSVDVWDSVARVLDSALADAGGTTSVRGIGIACAGPIDADAGTVSPMNIPAWRDYPLLSRARHRYPGVAVRLEGDGPCMALGEHRHGSGRGTRALLGMVVSTGVGGGLVLDGQPYRGPSGNAGHLGHVIAEPGGRPCPCGGRGCLETVASGRSMVRWARENGWDAPEGTTARELADDARSGGGVPAATFERAGWAIGLALAGASALVDLDRVVIGGGVARAGDLLFTPVREALREHARMAFQRRLAVTPSALGELAGALGASELV